MCLFLTKSDFICHSFQCFLFASSSLSLWIVFNIVTTSTCTIAGSVVLTQTHPAAPYVCRTGNITLRCQYESVENVLVVLWIIGFQITSNPSTIPGHTALPRTTIYQEVVVDSYTNLAAGYRCTPTLSNGSLLLSNQYNPQYECEFLPNRINFCCAHRVTCMPVRRWQSSNVLLYSIIIIV